MAKDPKREFAAGRRHDETKLEVGDKIVILPMNFIEPSSIGFVSHAYENKNRFYIGRYYAFPDTGILCAINRKNADNNKFVPFVLRTIYITSWLLCQNRKIIYSPSRELLEKSFTRRLVYKIIKDGNIHTALQSDMAYIVQGVSDFKVDVVIGHQDKAFSPREFTRIGLLQSDIPVSCDNVCCRIGNQTLEKQLFIDYLKETFDFEENEIYTLPQDEIEKQRGEAEQHELIAKQNEQNWLLRSYQEELNSFKECYKKNYEQRGKDYCQRHYYRDFNFNNRVFSQIEVPSYSCGMGISLVADCLNGYSTNEKYRNMDERTKREAEQLRQKCISDVKTIEDTIDMARLAYQRKQEEIERSKEWKDIGTVRVAQQVSYHVGNSNALSLPKFEHHSICELQTNIGQTRFRVKISDKWMDLKRVNLDSFLRPKWAYQAANCNYYILEDLSKFKFWT